MKASEFKKLIKEAVREAIQEELGALQSTPEQPVQETKQAPAPTKPLFNKSNPLMEMLNQTAASMTNEDFSRTVSMDSTAARGFNVGGGQQVGLDLSNLDFAKKAGDIFKASVEKDKMRHGV